jgi:hypothetical protein
VAICIIIYYYQHGSKHYEGNCAKLLMLLVLIRSQYNIYITRVRSTRGLAELILVLGISSSNITTNTRYTKVEWFKRFCICVGPKGDGLRYWWLLTPLRWLGSSFSCCACTSSNYNPKVVYPEQHLPAHVRPSHAGTTGIYHIGRLQELPAQH